MFALLFGAALAGTLVLTAVLARLHEPGAPAGAAASPGALLLRPHRAVAYLINLIDPRR
jgi:hypothetical protein